MKSLTAGFLLITQLCLFVNSKTVLRDPEVEIQVSNIIEKFRSTLDDSLSKLNIPDDTFLNISEYLTKYGYPFESHQVTTDDGFILELHRIPAIQDADKDPKPGVFFIPPLLCSSIDWVSRGPNSSLGLLLYDLGYDIWLLNPRGTRYSMKHLTLNSSEKEFWEFSFHEKGYYDAAASVDYILNTTGLEKLTTVGFSEGTSASLAFTATRPEYNEKINLVVLLSPIGYMGGVTSPLVLIATKYMTEIKALADLIHLYGIPYSEWIGKLLVAICGAEGFDQICASVLDWIGGFDEDQHDLEWFLVAISDKPSGVSVRQLYHYGQQITAGTFREYDYGSVENLAIYGSAEPPAYNVANITAPVAAYYSKNDFFASIEDVERLLSQLPNVADAYLIEMEKFSHIDFFGAKDVKTLLYDRVLSTIENYNN